MPFRRAVIFCLVAVAVSCTRSVDRPIGLTPTTPSVLAAMPGALLTAPVPAAGKLDALFPPRNDTFDFFQQLIAKYRDGLGRTGSLSFVDSEGEVVWTQEYYRYRANGCGHEDALQRVF